MTTPKIETFRRGGARWYRDPITGDEYIGVTSLIGLLPSPWLAPWNAKITAEYCVDNIGSITQMVLDALTKSAKPDVAMKSVVDHCKAASRRHTSIAADRGSEIHNICEQLLLGKNPAIHNDLRGYIAGFEAFLNKYQPEVLWVEQTVFNESMGYAGTADALLKIGSDICVIDWKSGRSVGSSAGLQAACYGHAEWVAEWVEPPESLTTVNEPTVRQVPLPKVDGAFIVHLQAEEKDTRIITADIHDPSVMDVIEALAGIQKLWEADLSKRILGKPLALD